MRFRVSIAGLLSFALLACASEVDPGVPTEIPRDASLVVVLPDTQFYSCAYGEIFEQQTAWVAEQGDARNIAMLLHTGDIVDDDVDVQWQVAARSLDRLNDRVPYLITTGNHDLSPARESMFERYLGTRGLDMFDHDRGAYEPGRSDNSYAVVRITGRDWLVLGLEFGPRDPVVAWAKQILEQYAELPAIVFTHAYLYNDGMRYDRRRMPRQRYHPDTYGQTPEQGINDGEDLWNKLVLAHDNVRLVLSGHVIPDGTARASERRASGTIVHQVLANYQWCSVCPCEEREGGGGYLRLLAFTNDAITVFTYSPYRDEWLRDAENQFELGLN